MDKYIMMIENDKVTIQSFEYIEDGFFIEIKGSVISLFEIPQFGGEVQTIGNFKTVIEAINAGKALT